MGNTGSVRPERVRYAIELLPFYLRNGVIHAFDKTSAPRSANNAN